MTLMRGGYYLRLAILLSASSTIFGIRAGRSHAQAVTSSPTDSAAREQPTSLTEIPFEPRSFERYAGYYQFSASEFLHAFMDADGHYFYQLTGQRPVRVYARSETTFFTENEAEQLRFESDSQGNVMSTVLQQNDGTERAATKVDKSIAISAESARNRTLSDRPASPGTEESLRRYIYSLERGHPNYEEMSPKLATVVEIQLRQIMRLIAGLGDFKSLTYEGGDSDGTDVYVATFADGQLEWHIAPLDGGKVVRRYFSRLP
jgi:hypothetical protein